MGDGIELWSLIMVKTLARTELPFSLFALLSLRLVDLYLMACFWEELYRKMWIRGFSFAGIEWCFSLLMLVSHQGLNCILLVSSLYNQILSRMSSNL